MPEEEEGEFYEFGDDMEHPGTVHGVVVKKEPRYLGEYIDSGVLICKKAPPSFCSGMKGGVAISSYAHHGMSYKMSGGIAICLETKDDVGSEMEGGLAIVDECPKSLGSEMKGGLLIGDVILGDIGEKMQSGVALAFRTRGDVGPKMKGGIAIARECKYNIGYKMKGGIAIAGEMGERGTVGQQMEGGIAIGIMWAEDLPVAVIHKTSRAVDKEKFGKVMEAFFDLRANFGDTSLDIEGLHKIFPGILGRLNNAIADNRDNVNLPGLRALEKGEKNLVISDNFVIGNAYNYQEIWSERLEALKIALIDLLPDQEEYIEQQFETVWAKTTPPPRHHEEKVEKPKPFGISFAKYQDFTKRWPRKTRVMSFSKVKIEDLIAIVKEFVKGKFLVINELDQEGEVGLACTAKYAGKGIVLGITILEDKRAANLLHVVVTVYREDKKDAMQFYRDFTIVLSNYIEEKTGRQEVVVPQQNIEITIKDSIVYKSWIGSPEEVARNIISSMAPSGTS